MAAKKKKKAKKAKAVKARKAKGKSPAKKSRTVARKAGKTPAKKKKKAVKAARKKAPARKPAKKAKRKQTVGEGDYQASRAFLRDQSNFVEKNRARIPTLGQQAEKALEGPEGDALRDAEATAAARSRDLF